MVKWKGCTKLVTKYCWKQRGEPGKMGHAKPRRERTREVVHNSEESGVMGSDAMKPSIALEQNRCAIRQIVERHHAVNARVFGSVLAGDDRSDSDLDLLVDPTSETTLLDIGAIRHELLELLGVPVDVLTPKALPERFRDAVLEEAEPV